MTLILTCLTKNFVVQASDRRFSYRDESLPPEDARNKALIYSTHSAFAFTGMARLLGESAIDWAAKRLFEAKNLDDAVRHLGNCASDLMNSDPISRQPLDSKKLAFVGAGFAEVIGEDERKSRWPFRMVISNFFRGEDSTWLPQPRHGFKVHRHLMGERRNFELFVAGQNLPTGREEQLNKLIAWCLRHKKGPETIGRLLAREIQATADGGNKKVGKNIMCTFVPREFGDEARIHLGTRLVNNPVPSEEPQILGEVEVVSLHDRFAIPPPFDYPRVVYVAGDNLASPYYNPLHVVPGVGVITVNMDAVQITVPPVVPKPNSQSDIPKNELKARPYQHW